MKDKKFAIWGLARANTDDIREAPSLTMIDELLKAGAQIQVFDPNNRTRTKNLWQNTLGGGKDEYEILKNADVLLIVTNGAIPITWF